MRSARLLSAPLIAPLSVTRMRTVLMPGVIPVVLIACWRCVCVRVGCAPVGGLSSRRSKPAVPFVALPSASHSSICTVPVVSVSLTVAVAVMVWLTCGRGTLSDAVGLFASAVLTSMLPMWCQSPAFQLHEPPLPDASSASTT
jgi:hypothetical protein